MADHMTIFRTRHYLAVCIRLWPARHVLTLVLRHSGGWRMRWEVSR